MGQQIRVMIVDDHHMVRTSLSMALGSFDDLLIVGQASNGKEAVELYETLLPDVVLMDLMMPVMDGIDAIRTIISNHALTRIIALTSFAEQSMVHDALAAGAMSYLLKNSSMEELIAAIHDAMVGKPVLAPEATRALVTSVRQPQLSIDLFSDREREVLRLMAAGNTNRQISQLLNISLSTVKFYVSNILAKLNAESRTEAVALALQHNLLS